MEKIDTLPSPENMLVFAAVVEAKSFSAAAEKLGLSIPVVSKRVSALERELGARLLNRTTRRLSLTEAGALFYGHCSRVAAEIAEAQAAVNHLNGSPRGLLRVTAPVTFGSHQLAGAVPGFLERYPEIQLEMDLSDRRVDLAQEGYDLAVRITNQPSSNLAARLLTRTRRIACAAPAYWDRHGRPQIPGELAEHDCIIYMPNPSFNQWLFTGPQGTEVVQVQGRLRVNNTEAMLEAAIGGQGVVRLTSFSLDRAIASGQLEPVLTDYESPDTDIYALYLPNRYLSTKARAFIDYMVAWYQGRA